MFPEIDLFDFTIFFGLDFLKFSGPLCVCNRFPILQAEIMTQYNNETKVNYINKFNELKAEDDEFKANMTERDLLILEAQGLITNGDERRKREGV